MGDICSYALDGKIAVITMDDGKANALSVEMIDALLAALAKAETEASAVVLAGRPDRFCAGFDLRVMMSGPEQAKALLGRGSDLLLKLFGLPLPLVIAATGHALAGGALVVLTGDTRIGAQGAYKLGLNEVAIGLPVPVLAMEFARARLAPAELTKATLQAQIYTPDDAVRAGYLDAVAPAEHLLAKAMDEANRLAGLARSAYKATKLRLRGGVIADIRARMEEDMRTLMNP
ncbi:MAG: crotonase/enoyl-CoA hydratase family protein [Myxococcales bacterium]|nr:crotonase/enoyl-CoA hydratase family protein [Myxococcales bacterium]